MESIIERSESTGNPPRGGRRGAGDQSHCQACGACCATFRVSFPRDELDEIPGGRVPAGLAEPITAQVFCMRGTGSPPQRCVALQGQIGTAVSCAIYELRPEACREFAPLAALGRGDDACNEARRRHRLTPLQFRHE